MNNFQSIYLYKKLKSQYYSYQNIKLHYLKYGEGDHPLLCFHGYGQDASIFKSLGHKLSHHYTIYAFDLFFHGKSMWSDSNTPLRPELLTSLINQWLLSENLKAASICGYSLGGKIALSLVQNAQFKIEKLLLIAPDGIQTNFWYNFATYPYWSRWLFKSTIKHPFLFFKTSDLLKSLRIVDQKLVIFAKLQMNNENKRRKVYDTWIIYRKLRPNIPLVADIINSKGIQLSIYLGKYDKIITEQSILPLLKRLTNYEKFKLETGHNALIQTVSDHISTEF